MYMCIVGPLEKLRKIRRITKAEWMKKHEEAFALLKGVLSQAPVLNVPEWGEKFIVATDASQYGIGAVLYQKNKREKLRYIEFAAKALNTAQSNYPALKRELLALYFALKR